jgi:hypothetical protein
MLLVNTRDLELINSITKNQVGTYNSIISHIELHSAASSKSNDQYFIQLDQFCRIFYVGGCTVGKENYKEEAGDINIFGRCYSLKF